MRERDLIVLKSEKRYLPNSIVMAIIVLLVHFFVTVGCKNNEVNGQIKDQMIEHTKGNEMSILHKKPVYSLKVDVSGAYYIITVNGATVIYDLSSKGQTTVILPVNHWMRSGENSIGFDVFPPEPGKPFNPNSYVKIDLTVHEDSEPEKVFNVTSIHFVGTKDKDNSHTSSSSPSGIYSSANGFTSDKYGDVKIFDVVGTVRPAEFEYDGVIFYQRKINIPSSLPLWAFFNSEEMPDYQLTAVDEKDFYKSIAPLYAEYEKVQNALAKKDIESILPMFEERNRETDMAFYLEPGTTAKRMQKALLETISDKNLKLVELSICSIAFFHLENNKKLASLRRESFGSAIALNYVNEKKGMGSERYPMFFRYQDGKYILTR